MIKEATALFMGFVIGGATVFALALPTAVIIILLEAFGAIDVL